MGHFFLLRRLTWFPHTLLDPTERPSYVCFLLPPCAFPLCFSFCIAWKATGPLYDICRLYLFFFRDSQPPVHPLRSFRFSRFPSIYFSFILRSYPSLVLMHRSCIFRLSQCEGSVFVLGTPFHLARRSIYMMAHY